MDDICNVVFLRFRDVTKQNSRTSVGTLYRGPLGEIVVCYDNVYKYQKGLSMRIPLYALKIFGLFSCWSIAIRYLLLLIVAI